ncbi:hypothetical protein [Nonomuraea roseoviolacea]|uniref:hypothetical protein n=1 Tax=Nonomuraea roseoviolacea TaxID=103837 RepID=UPI0031D85337
MDTAESVGRNVARDWPFIDVEDVTQHILTAACARADEYNGMDSGALRYALKTEAVAYCARERADYITRSARYVYTPSEVRALLDIWSEGAESECAQPPTRDGYVAAPDAGNIMVSLWDLDSAVEALPDRWRMLVNAKVAGGQLDQADYRAYLRAVDRLTLILNRAVNRPPGDHDGPGARKAIPNARAAAITHDERDGS